MYCWRTGKSIASRNIEDIPIERDDDTEVAGYLTPAGLGDPDYRFDGTLENFPEGWTEERKELLKLRPYRKMTACRGR